MNNLQSLIQSSISLGVASVIEQLGIHSGVISFRQAKIRYGKWFVDAVNDDKLRPVRVQSGRTGTKFYRLVDILALEVEDRSRAELIL